MISSMPIGAKVIFADGSAGKLTGVVVDPASRSITHVAVVEKSMLHGEERLVPVDQVASTTRDTVQLNCSVDDFVQMEPFTRTHYLEVDQGAAGYAYSPPYLTTGYDMMPPAATYPVVTDVIVPSGEVAIHRGMAVEALDGLVGEVGELLIDSQSGQITHFLLMKGHGWGKQEVAIQLDLIDRLEGETLHLKVDKEKIAQIPSLPVNRKWNEVNATELELMVWVFEEQKLASKLLKRVQKISKEASFELLNATVIEKDAEGFTHVREKKKMPSKGRVALGIALGGMAGLLIGPVALVAGAVAGAAAGKKSARKVEVGFSEDKLRQLNECLIPGGSALVVLVEHRWFNMLQVELAEEGGRFISERLIDIKFDELTHDMHQA